MPGPSGGENGYLILGITCCVFDFGHVVFEIVGVDQDFGGGLSMRWPSRASAVAS